MLKWRDISERTCMPPRSAWELEVSTALVVRVHRIRGLGATWFCSCPDLSIRATALDADTGQAARREGVGLVLKRLFLLSDAHQRLKLMAQEADLCGEC
jgi:hypothetical protein